MCNRPPGPLAWAFGPRNVMKTVSGGLWSKLPTGFDRAAVW